MCCIDGLNAWFADIRWFAVFGLLIAALNEMDLHPPADPAAQDELPGTESLTRALQRYLHGAIDAASDSIMDTRYRMGSQLLNYTPPGSRV